MKGIKMLGRVGLMAAVLSLSGCSVIPDWMNPGTWFEDEEEAAIKELKPISAKFTPSILWDGEVGSGVEYYFSRLSPAVGYDKVFAASRQGLILAFDQQSGKRLWSLDLAEYRDEGMLSGVSRIWSDGISAKVAGGLAVSYSAVYFGTENGLVFSVDAETGKINWQTKVKGEVLAKPAVDEGLVVVNTGAGTLFALDAETGEERWTHESEVPALTLRGIAIPTISNGGVIVGTSGGKVAVNIVESGQTLWEQTVAAPTGATELERLVDIDSQTIVFGGVIYVVSYNGTLAAMDLRTGRVIWKREYRSYRRMSLVGNSLIVVDDKSQVYALDRRNGVELWAQVSLRGRDLTAATAIRDYVVVGDKYGYLHWLKQESGDIVSRYQFGANDEDEGVFVAPVVDGNAIYSVSRDGRIIALQTP